MSASSESPNSTPQISSGADLPQSTARREFWLGVQRPLPLLLGDLPFGMIYSALAVGAGLSPAAAQAMSAILFAGSAQFVTVGLVAENTPALVIILSVVVVNLRHLLYSASVAPYLKPLPGRWKAVLAYLLTDEAYALTITRLESAPAPFRHWFMLGASLTLWASWQLSTAMGILLGAIIPESWSLDFTLALTFIALVFPAIQDRPSLAAALAAGVTAVLARGLPYQSGLIAAALAGVLAGVILERRSSSSIEKG